MNGTTKGLTKNIRNNQKGIRGNGKRKNSQKTQKKKKKTKKTEGKNRMKTMKWEILRTHAISYKKFLR